MMGLEILRSEEPRKFTRPIRSFIGFYMATFSENHGGRRFNGIWGRMAHDLVEAFEVPDPDTGEIMMCWPDEETWKEEVKGYFKNEYAKSQRYPWKLFLKQFGQYAVPEAKKIKREPKIVRWATCDKCLADYIEGTVHEC